MSELDDIRDFKGRLDELENRTAEALTLSLNSLREKSVRQQDRQPLRDIDIGDITSALTAEPRLPMPPDITELPNDHELEGIVASAFRRIQDAMAAKARLARAGELVSITKDRGEDTTAIQAVFDRAAQQYASVLQAVGENDPQVSRAVASSMDKGNINSTMAKVIANAFDHIAAPRPATGQTGSGTPVRVGVDSGKSMVDSMFADLERRVTANASRLFKQADERETAESRDAFPDSGTQQMSIEEQIQEQLDKQLSTRRQRKQYNEKQVQRSIPDEIHMARAAVADKGRVAQMSSPEFLRNSIVANLLTEEQMGEQDPVKLEELVAQAAQQKETVDRIVGRYGSRSVIPSVLNKLNATSVVAPTHLGNANTPEGDSKRLLDLAIKTGIGRTSTTEHYKLIEEQLKAGLPVYDDQVAGYNRLKKDIGESKRYHNVLPRPVQEEPESALDKNDILYENDTGKKVYVPYKPEKSVRKMPEDLPLNIYSEQQAILDQIANIKETTDARDGGSELVRKETVHGFQYEKEAQGRDASVEGLQQEFAKNKERIDQYRGNLQSYVELLGKTIDAENAKGEKGNPAFTRALAGQLGLAKQKLKEAQSGLFIGYTPGKEKYSGLGETEPAPFDREQMLRDVARTRNIAGMGSNASVTDLQGRLKDERALKFYLERGSTASDEYFDNLSHLRSSTDLGTTAEELVGKGENARFIYGDYATKVDRTHNETLNRVAKMVKPEDQADFQTVSSNMYEIDQHLKTISNPESTKEQVADALNAIDEIVKLINGARSRISAFIAQSAVPQLELQSNPLISASGTTQKDIDKKLRAPVATQLNGVQEDMDLETAIAKGRKSAADQVLKYANLTEVDLFKALHAGTQNIKLNSLKFGGVETKTDVDREVPEGFIADRIDTELSGEASLDRPKIVRHPLSSAYAILLREKTGLTIDENGPGATASMERDTADQATLHEGNLETERVGDLVENIIKTAKGKIKRGSQPENVDSQRLFDRLSDIFQNDESVQMLRARGEILTDPEMSSALETAATDKGKFSTTRKTYTDIARVLNAWTGKAGGKTPIEALDELNAGGVDVERVLQFIENPTKMRELFADLKGAEGGRNGSGESYEDRFLAALRKGISTSGTTAPATTAGGKFGNPVPDWNLGDQNIGISSTGNVIAKVTDNGERERDIRSKGISVMRGEQPDYNPEDGLLYLARTGLIGDEFGDATGKIKAILRERKELPGGGYRASYGLEDIATGETLEGRTITAIKDYVNGKPREDVKDNSGLDWNTVEYLGRKKPSSEGYEKLVMAKLNSETLDEEDYLAAIEKPALKSVNSAEELLKAEMAARLATAGGVGSIAPPGVGAIPPSKWENNTFTNNRFVGNTMETVNHQTGEVASSAFGGGGGQGFGTPYLGYNPTAGAPGSPADLLNQFAVDLLGFDVNRVDARGKRVENDVYGHSLVGRYPVNYEDKEGILQKDLSIEDPLFNPLSYIGRQTPAIGRYIAGNEEAQQSFARGGDWEAGILRSFQGGEYDRVAQGLQSRLNGIADPLIRKYFLAIERFITEQLGAMFNQEQLNGSSSFYISSEEAKHIPMTLGGLIQQQLPQYKAAGSRIDILAGAGYDRKTMRNMSDFGAEAIPQVGAILDGGQVVTQDLMNQPLLGDADRSMSQEDIKKLRMEAYEKYKPQLVMENAKYRQNWMKNTMGIWEMSYAARGILQGAFGFDEGSTQRVMQGLNIARSTMYTGSTVIDALRNASTNRLTKDPRYEQAQTSRLAASQLDFDARDNREKRTMENDAYQNAKAVLKRQLMSQNPSRQMRDDYVYTIGPDGKEVIDESAGAQLRGATDIEAGKKQLSDVAFVGIRQQQNVLRKGAKEDEDAAKKSAAGFGNFFNKWGNLISGAVMLASAIPQIIQQQNAQVEKKNQEIIVAQQFANELTAASAGVRGFAQSLKSLDALIAAVSKFDPNFVKNTTGESDYRKKKQAEATLTMEGTVVTPGKGLFSKSAQTTNGDALLRQWQLYTSVELQKMYPVGPDGKPITTVKQSSAGIRSAISDLQAGGMGLTPEQNKRVSEIMGIIDQVSLINPGAAVGANTNGIADTIHEDILRAQLDAEQRTASGVDKLNNQAKASAFTNLLYGAQTRAEKDAFKNKGELISWAGKNNTSLVVDAALGSMGTGAASYTDMIGTRTNGLWEQFKDYKDIAGTSGRNAFGEGTDNHDLFDDPKIRAAITSGSFIDFGQAIEYYDLNKKGMIEPSQKTVDADVAIATKEFDAAKAWDQPSGAMWAYDQWKTYNPLAETDATLNTDTTVWNPKLKKEQTAAKYAEDLKATSIKGLEGKDGWIAKLRTDLGALTYGTKEWDTMNNQLNQATQALSELKNASDKLTSTWFNIGGSVVHPTKSAIENNIYPNLTVYIDGVKTDAKVVTSKGLNTVTPITTSTPGTKTPRLSSIP